MKLLSLAILGTGLFFGSLNEPKTFDIAAHRVIENRTSMGGIYYSYEVKNSGETTIAGGNYTVFFKVNGKKVSFDKATSDIQPGEIIRYRSQKTFYQKGDQKLDYSLEITYDDSDLSNNTLLGQSAFN